MAKKSVLTPIKKAASDVADAVSVAATGFQVGVLEMAAEEDLTGEPTPRPKRKNVVRKNPIRKNPERKNPVRRNIKRK
jgi:hypothetical protein